MDDTKLAVGGHSFGGITAVKTAFLDKRVKACLAFDPWLYLHESDILKGTPITEAALLCWKEIGINCRKYFIADIP